MANFTRTRALITRFVKDKQGSFAMAMGVSALAVVLTSGAAYDYTQLTKAKFLAQVAADNMALSASIAVDLDNETRYVQDAPYDYRELGGPSDDFTDSMVGRVQYDVDDNDDGEPDLLARATVTGIYQPAFMSIVPGIGGLGFSAVSDVAYAQVEGTPASIFFVTDNSGSMRSDDANGVPKIDSLRSSMINFMGTLSAISVTADETFRTALYPYNAGIIVDRIVNPKWDVLTNQSINIMRGFGGTRSTGALMRARVRFPFEDDIHDGVNGEGSPLKFLIFMSDGANNGAFLQQPQCGVDFPYRYWIDTFPGQNNRLYCQPRSWFDNWVVFYPGDPLPGPSLVSPVNIASLAECTSMKDNGVIIYSIAYDVAANERALAEAFMQECSSGEDFYQYASDGSDLREVFDAIGESIIQEVIRIKK